MPLRLRVPRAGFVGRALATAAVVSASVAGVSAQSSRGTVDRPVRISRWPCRVIAKLPLRKVMDKGWDRSETIRRQCEELALARAVVVLEWGSSDSQSHAKTGMAIQDDVVVARVRIPPVGQTIVLLAHELQHVVEKTRGLDFEAEAKRPGSGVWQAFDGFETQGAIDIGRQVEAECRQRHGSSSEHTRSPEIGLAPVTQRQYKGPTPPA